MTPDPRASDLEALTKLQVISTRRIVERLIAKADEEPKRAWWRSIWGTPRDREEAR